MGSNPIIGTCEKAFHEGKATNIARLADSAHSRVSSDEPRKWDHGRTSPIFFANKVISLCKE
jgi:hypothetical protein